MPWHWHDEVEINYVTEGSLLGMADGKSFRLQAGQALFVGSGVLHGNRAVEENGLIHQISIVFDPSVVGGAILLVALSLFGFDFDTVGDEANGIAADHCVTIRERDSMEQVRIPIDQVRDFLREKCAF